MKSRYFIEESACWNGPRDARQGQGIDEIAGDDSTRKQRLYKGFNNCSMRSIFVL